MCGNLFVIRIRGLLTKQRLQRLQKLSCVREWFVPLQAELSALSAYGTNWRDYIRENFRLFVVTKGNEDEAEIANTGPAP